MLGELPNKALHLTAAREAAADEPAAVAGSSTVARAVVPALTTQQPHNASSSP